MRFLSSLVNLSAILNLERGVNVFFIENTWVLLTVELKRRIPYTGVFCVIISKFRYRQEPCPVVLFVINKGFKVSFHCAVLLFSLAIGLRVEDNRESLFDSQKVAQEEPELRREY